MGVNFIFMIGNLTRDPETRTIPGGATVTDFGFATNETWKDEQGEKRERVCFIDVSVWGARGEAVQKYCRKGNQVGVRGRLDLERWDDRETNKPRSRHKITASEVLFLNTTGGGGAGGDNRTRRDRGGASPTAQSARDDYRRGRDAQQGNGASVGGRQDAGGESGGSWNPDAQDAQGGDAMKPLREAFGEEEFKEDDIPF